MAARKLKERTWPASPVWYCRHPPGGSTGELQRTWLTCRHEDNGKDSGKDSDLDPPGGGGGGDGVHAGLAAQPGPGLDVEVRARVEAAHLRQQEAVSQGGAWAHSGIELGTIDTEMLDGCFQLMFSPVAALVAWK